VLKSGLLIALTAGASLAQTPQNPFAGDPTAAGVGRGTFRIYCSPCHGMRAQGGRGPDLTRRTYASGDHDADLFRVISKGIPGTPMAAYGDVLTEDNIWRIVAYLRAAARQENDVPLGDPKRGEALFWGKGQCGGCHRIGTRGGGGGLGPDLTSVGRQRSLAHIRTSIVDPSQDLVDGYKTLSVVLPDGRKLTGVERGYDNFTVQLLDTAGNFHSFERSELRSVELGRRSLMPDGYGKLFSKSELDDLLAYLAAQRGVEVKR
jgi:putative heme-binding domain-containing protein